MDDASGMLVLSLHSLKIVLHVLVCGVKRGQAFGIGEASSLWKMGQLISNMGPEWSEVHIHPVMAATTSKRLFAFIFQGFFS
jgi:hypothetical protein